MSYKCKTFYFIIISAFLLTGCEEKTQNNKVIITQVDNQESKSESTPQKESAETSEYKKLKKQIEITGVEVEKAKNKRNKILEEYQPTSVEGREVSKELEKAEEKLNQLKSQSDTEAKNFGRKPEYFPF